MSPRSGTPVKLLGREDASVLKKEQEEKEQKRKEKAEAHLYTIIKVARDEDLLEQIGRDIYILILWIMTKFEVFVFRNKCLSTFSRWEI
ncbi:uncharacterized protein LOC114271017 isoform X2 [Camellia sinensis]|uniref:uncharacterized protein LOC114271017 isoform X2 n=1 Tax=Camellia sinensis TaxID=4442 RepID=UPI0010360728|nr:uncharacterized protein LOC114271017 isoform X2 [Camellia sinensis]